MYILAEDDLIVSKKIINLSQGQHVKLSGEYRMYCMHVHITCTICDPL